MKLSKTHCLLNGYCILSIKQSCSGGFGKDKKKNYILEQ